MHKVSDLKFRIQRRKQDMLTVKFLKQAAVVLWSSENLVTYFARLYVMFPLYEDDEKQSENQRTGSVEMAAYKNSSAQPLRWINNLN